MALPTTPTFTFPESSTFSPPSHTGYGYKPHKDNSPGASPPFITAFLAIGLFVALIVLLLWWRRTHLARSLLRRALVPGESNSPHEMLEKPKLWSPWNADEMRWNQITGRSEDRTWKNIMPLMTETVSTMSTRDLIQYKRSEFSTGSETSPRPPFEDGTNVRDSWRHFLRNVCRHVATTSKDIPELHKLPSIPSTSKILRVGVVILLPSAHYPMYVKQRTFDKESSREPLQNRDERPNYAIGLHNEPWKL